METVTLERELTLIIEDTAVLILSIAVLTVNFTSEGLIEEVHKFVYKSLLEARNYLRSDSIKNPLLSYIAVSVGRKDKEKLPPISLPLIVLERSKNSIPSLLLQYNTQISSGIENQITLLPIWNINNSSAFKQLLPV